MRESLRAHWSPQPVWSCYFLQRCGPGRRSYGSQRRCARRLWRPETAAWSRETSGWNLVDLGGHDEIAFGQAVDAVRPQRDFHFAPREQNVGMMALLFREDSDAVHEVERLLEIWKFEGARAVVFVDDLPVGKLVAETMEFVAL